MNQDYFRGFRVGYFLRFNFECVVRGRRVCFDCEFRFFCLVVVFIGVFRYLYVVLGGNRSLNFDKIYLFFVCFRVFEFIIIVNKQFKREGRIWFYSFVLYLSLKKMEIFFLYFMQKQFQWRIRIYWWKRDGFVYYRQFF